MKIYTAEELLDDMYPCFEDLDSGNIWVNIENAMIEFAKMHVQAAIDKADGEAPFFYSERIKNCYPLTNIK